MATLKMEHEIRHGELKVFVTAESGTHHSTIAGDVWRYIRELSQPDYVSRVTGTRPGKWCQPQYSGPWRRVGTGLTPDTHIRKTFTSWPVPDYSAPTLDGQ